MSVSAVQNYDSKNTFSNVLISTAVGGAIGYGAKYNIPLKEREKKDINYRAIVNATRKDVNANKANSFKILKTRTPAQDEFVKLVDNKEPFKNPSLTTLAERLGGETTPLGKKVLETIKDGMTFNELVENISAKSEDRQIFVKAFEDKEAFQSLPAEEILAKLGGKDAPVAKKVAELFEQNKGKNLSFDQVADSIGKSSKEVSELKRVSRLTNAFANENVEMIVRRLGGAESKNGQEFKRIISEVDKNASEASRKLLQSCHKLLKEKRYTAPLVIAGAAAGFAAAFIHNFFSHKTEA